MKRLTGFFKPKPKAAATTAPQSNASNDVMFDNFDDVIYALDSQGNYNPDLAALNPQPQEPYTTTKRDDVISHHPEVALPKPILAPPIANLPPKWQTRIAAVTAASTADIARYNQAKQAALDTQAPQYHETLSAHLHTMAEATYAIEMRLAAAFIPELTALCKTANLPAYERQAAHLSTPQQHDYLLKLIETASKPKPQPADLDEVAPMFLAISRKAEDEKIAKQEQDHKVTKEAALTAKKQQEFEASKKPPSTIGVLNTIRILFGPNRRTAVPQPAFDPAAYAPTTQPPESSLGASDAPKPTTEDRLRAFEKARKYRRLKHYPGLNETVNAIWTDTLLPRIRQPEPPTLPHIFSVVAEILGEREQAQTLPTTAPNTAPTPASKPWTEKTTQQSPVTQR